MGPEVEAGFVRNRRFLIAVSVGLACVNVLGLKFTKVSLLGNEAEIHDASAVYVVAWLIWVWAYAQYIVWFIDAGAWSKFWQAVNTHRRTTLGRRAAQGEPPGWAWEVIHKSISDQLAGFPQSRETIKMIKTYAPVPLEEGREQPRTANINLKASALLPDNRGYFDSAETLRYEVPIDEGEWERQTWRSMLWIAATRRFTLEYFFPFAIGLLPVGLAVYAHWRQLIGYF